MDWIHISVAVMLNGRQTGVRAHMHTHEPAHTHRHTKQHMTIIMFLIVTRHDPAGVKAEVEVKVKAEVEVGVKVEVTVNVKAEVKVEVRGQRLPSSNILLTPLQILCRWAR